MGIDVERNGQLFAHLNVEVTQAVFAEHAEDTAFGILLVGFDYELLGFPSVTGALRNAAAGFERCNDFSRYFHVSIV